MWLKACCIAKRLTYGELLLHGARSCTGTHCAADLQHHNALIAAELLQEALSLDNAAVNGLTASGLAALFAEAWFPSLTPGYGAAGQSWHCHI